MRRVTSDTACDCSYETASQLNRPEASRVIAQRLNNNIRNNR